ncbi:MAG: hypothetical protein OQL19_21875 [Gammaproteobacteria bacterium]|nr:hypothetical protein [Gammaproteobacteria bacterium]
MGQEIDFNPDDWDFLEETELESIKSDISLPSDFYKGNFVARPHDEDADTDITAYIDGEKFQINTNKSDHVPGSQEEEAFRRQIEDLFELLELEKESGKENGVRVYQTDSSPSRPWRFH